jgi:hypothetical protein
MDNNANHAGGPFAATLSVLASILAWVSIRDVQVFFGIGASCIAIVSGAYAIMYYRKKLKE